MKLKLILTLVLLTKVMASQSKLPLSKFVNTSNGNIHYLEYGSENKEILFLFHGIPGSSHSWNSLACKLANEYRVIVPDMLGFGGSSKPMTDYYIKGQTQAFFELYKSITDDSVFVFGHDFGGPISITLLKDHPEMKIKKLILSSTNMFIDTYIPPPMRLAKVPILGDIFFWIMAGNKLGMKMLYTQAVKNKTTYPLSEYKKGNSKSSMKYTMRIFKKSLGNLKLHYGAIQNYLPEIKIPVLVLWGDSDPFFALDVANRTKKSFSNSSLVIYESTGHFVPSEQPEKVAKDVTGFLSKK